MVRTRSNLKLVPTTPPGHPQPPGPLDQFGLDLWIAITSQYHFDDVGSFEVLYQACCCRSRAERCRKLIEGDGEFLRLKGGIRAHPCIREESAARALTVRMIKDLGLNLEPLHDRPGRPSGR